MTDLLDALRAHTAWAMFVALAGFAGLFAFLQVLSRTTSASPEVTRKLFHTGSGLLTLSFPFLFRDTWPVLLLTGASAVAVAAVKFLPVLRVRLGGVANRVERPTLGEIYFPVSVAYVFAATRDEHPLLFVIPILMLTFADATCALVGGRYGQTRYVGANKSVEGSIAFVVVAFFCVHVPLLLWSSIGRVESLLIAMTLALLVMLLEGSAWRGLDNLFIPIGGYFLLHEFVGMDVAMLTARLAVTLALVGLVAAARRRMTLEDDSLVAGVFLCYIAWAVMGWPWLVGPMAVAVGYRFMSRRTPDNSRRMHGVPAVLSIWAAALAWIVIARRGHDPSLVVPYTVVFAAHLACFGTSRLAFEQLDRSVAFLIGRATATAWAMVMAPLALAVARTPTMLAECALSVVAIGVGTLAFVASEPQIRNAPQTASRWLRQASAAGLASILAWAARQSLAWVLS